MRQAQAGQENEMTKKLVRKLRQKKIDAYNEHRAIEKIWLKIQNSSSEYRAWRQTIRKRDNAGGAFLVGWDKLNRKQKQELAEEWRRKPKTLTNKT